jgi:DNA-binding transcriptional MocR family regulator
MGRNAKATKVQSLDGLFKAVELKRLEFSRTRPLYRHLLQVLEAAIGRGDLTPGLRLPPERELARALKVSRTTVVNAYRELESRGLVRGYVGRGTFVCAAPDSAGAPFAWRGKVASAALRSNDSILRDLVRDASNPQLISLAAGVPALDRFPSGEFRRALDHVLQHQGEAVWRHGPTEGQPRLRATIGSRFGVPPQSVLIVAGAQQGLDLLSRCLVDPGDAVVMDRPGYLGAIQSFRSAGARLIGWDVRRGDVDELEDLLLRYRPKLIYTNPTFHNPTGFTLPLRARRDLLKLAGRYRVPIVEDGTYGELYLTSPPPPSLHQLDENNLVIHLNSFSKVLAPGLRLGWLAAAESIVEQLALIKQRVDPHTQNLVQFVVSHLIESGLFDEHLTGLRAEHARRCEAMLKALQRHLAPNSLRFSRPDGGLYFWCRLEQDLRARAVLHHAMASNVVFVVGEAFYVDQAGAQELRLCFSSVPSNVAEEGVKRLARSVAAAKRDPSQQALTVPIV